MKGTRKAEVLAKLILLVCCIGLASCSAIQMTGEELRARVSGASGFDGDAVARVEVGRWNGVAFRLFNLPFGPGLVWFGPMEEVEHSTLVIPAVIEPSK